MQKITEVINGHEIEYTKAGDYWIPNILPNPPQKKTYGRWGISQRKYLKVHDEPRYLWLKMMGELIPRLNQVDKEAWELHDRLVEQLKKSKKDTEPSSGTFKWAQWLTMINYQADEIVRHDIIRAEYFG